MESLVPFATLIALAFVLASISLLWKAHTKSRAQTFYENSARTAELRHLEQTSREHNRERDYDSHRRDMERQVISFVIEQCSRLFPQFFGNANRDDADPPSTPS